MIGAWLTSFLGWFGAVLLAACGVPLLLNTRASDRLFLWSWFAGEALLLTYVAATTHDPALLLNYGFNTGLVAIVLWRRRR